MLGLLDISTELLVQCVEDDGLQQRDLNSLRLTARRLYQILGPEPIDRLRVQLSSPGSLARLEEISQNPRAASTVQTLVFDLSYYDPIMAESLACFATCRSCDILSTVARCEPTIDPTVGGFYLNCDFQNIKRRSMRDAAEGTRISESWADIRDGICDQGNPTREQKILLESYQEYRRLFSEQELVKEDSQHIPRIVAAIKRFPCLVGVRIDDDGDSDVFRGFKAPFTDEELRSGCLMKYTWEGPSVPNHRGTPPPVHLLADVFEVLERASFFPKKFELALQLPRDHAVLQQTPDQLHRITRVLEMATNVGLCLTRYDQFITPPINDERARTEVRHLTALSSAFFDVPSLHTIDLCLDRYAFFSRDRQTPFSIAEVLPINTRTWTSLKHITLSSIPCHQSEIELLADILGSNAAEHIAFRGMHMRWGSWRESLNHLSRNCDQLNSADLTALFGGEFGERNKGTRRGLDGELSKYLLRQRETNPLSVPGGSMQWDPPIPVS